MACHILPCYDYKVALQKMFIILWMSVAIFIPRLFAALSKEPGVWLWMSGVANSHATMNSLSPML